VVEHQTRRAAFAVLVPRLTHRSLWSQGLATLVASCGHLEVPIEDKDWQRVMSAASELLPKDTKPALHATSFIWAASVYGRHGDASTVDFIRALCSLIERSRSARDACRAHQPLAQALRQASRALSTLTCQLRMTSRCFLMMQAMYSLGPQARGGTCELLEELASLLSLPETQEHEASVSQLQR
jgi:hypothetical protein